ncbi:alpha/beta hydrolase [Amycolatopsis minnesotensis]
MKRSRKSILALAAITVLGASAVPAAAAGQTRLSWGPCPDYDSTPSPTAGLECAKLTVPLDYAAPERRQIELTISRLPSKNPAKRRGVLLMNPGGPGGAGLAMPALLPKTGPAAALADRYDLIGFDPRGVGYSTPTTCGFTSADRNAMWPGYARGPEDVATYAGTAAAVARKCATARTKDLMPHITTANTARDLDAIRSALGARRISYYGNSYGSYLGAVYASLHPQRTDRVVLDSVTDPSGVGAEHRIQTAQGFDDRFPDFAAWAAARDSVYHFGSTPEGVGATYFRLAAQLDLAPVNGIDGKGFRFGTYEGLYQDERFPAIAETWLAAQGKPAPRAAPPALPDWLAENRAAAQLTLECNDSRWPRSLAGYQRRVETARLSHPAYGPAASNITPCAYWPEHEEGVRITGAGPRNVLLAQNLRDPATPLDGARRMSAALGHRAQLTLVDQGGHGVFRKANECANAAIAGYLAEGTWPTTFCARQHP